MWLKARRVASASIVPIEEISSIKEVLELIRSKNIKRLNVVGDKGLAGKVTYTDIFFTMLSLLCQMRKSLDHKK